MVCTRWRSRHWRRASPCEPQKISPPLLRRRDLRHQNLSASRGRLVPAAVMAMMVTVTLVVALLPPLAMMAVAGLLDRRASFACSRQLAENVAGGRGGLGATHSHDAGERAGGDGSEGEESRHVSSFFYF